MTMRVSREAFLGTEASELPSSEAAAAKMALDFEVAVFRRMKELGITQKELAERLGVSAATVSKTLSETSNMTFKTAARIAHALGCVPGTVGLAVWADADEAVPAAIEPVA